MMRYLKAIDARKYQTSIGRVICRFSQGTTPRVAGQHDLVAVKLRKLHHTHLVLNARSLRREYFRGPSRLDERDALLRQPHELREDALRIRRLLWRLLRFDDELHIARERRRQDGERSDALSLERIENLDATSGGDIFQLRD